jgi:hypothetical protein
MGALGADAGQAVMGLAAVYPAYYLAEASYLAMYLRRSG